MTTKLVGSDPPKDGVTLRPQREPACLLTTRTRTRTRQAALTSQKGCSSPEGTPQGGVVGGQEVRLEPPAACKVP